MTIFSLPQSCRSGSSRSGRDANFGGLSGLKYLLGVKLMFPSSHPRAEHLRTQAPQLIADVYLYPSSQGGRQSPASLGWGCPCCLTKEPPFEGWDAWPLLLDGPLSPGGRARVGFVFFYARRAGRHIPRAGDSSGRDNSIALRSYEYRDRLAGRSPMTRLRRIAPIFCVLSGCDGAPSRNHLGVVFFILDDMRLSQSRH
jgi:hypothetical protein